MLDPLLLSLHGSLVELALRVTRIERELQIPDAPRALFARPAAEYPALAAAEPCSCDEALTLRAQLERVLNLVDKAAANDR